MGAAVKVVHTFELSGLGCAPFVVVSANAHLKGEGSVFWCEHCGTSLKNRYFIKSSDGKVSVVGVDCLTKTGDQGLIDGQKRIARQHAAEIREALHSAQLSQSKALERKVNGGLTNCELIGKLNADIVELREGHYEAIQEHPVLRSLTEHGFEWDMRERALRGESFSAGMLICVKEIHTKKVSGARKNSKRYVEAAHAAFEEVAVLQARLVSIGQTIQAIRDQIVQIKSA